VARVGDIPLRAIYTVAALIAAILAVVLVFVVFAEDKPNQTVRIDKAQASQSAAPTSGTPAPPPPEVKLPPVPATKFFPVLAGTASVISAYVVDQKAGITYAQLGKPWAKGEAASFTAVQRAGTDTLPAALIASRSLPVAVPKTLTTAAQYRALAVKTAQWSLRYHPHATKVTWTASQSLRSDSAGCSDTRSLTWSTARSTAPGHRGPGEQREEEAGLAVRHSA